jgi:hypothetical protein
MPRERTLTHIDLLAGPGGWVQASWRRSDGSEGRVFVRFQPPRTRKARWQITDLQVPAPTTALLRDVPLARIEAATFASPPVLETLREWLDKKPATNLAEEFKGPYRETPRQYRLKRPPSRRLDDDFYRTVSWAYREAVARGMNPGKTLAEDSGTPQGTVNRWIAGARDRGYLPPGEPGKVSASVFSKSGAGVAGLAAGGEVQRQEGESDAR